MKKFCMKKNILSIIIFLFSFFLGISSTQATVIQGGINTNEQLNNFCTVIDKNTGKPVSNAKITVPSKGFIAFTDINGHFILKPQITNNTILSVTKDEYKPFSITISQNANNTPFILSIEKLSPFDIKIESDLCHLGDNNYSDVSANAGQFRGKAVGPVYNKCFFIKHSDATMQPYLIIGSIIGIDTALARGIGQNSITTAFASPPTVYLNGHKITEIQINGDNQRVKLPKQFIKFNQNNVITIKAGRNLMQTAYIDYDDIEFMNLSIRMF